MGYAQTRILMYGIEVDEKIAKKIEKDIMDEEGNITIPFNRYYRKLMDYQKDKGYKQNLPITPYKTHCDGSVDSVVFYPDLVAEDADSRIDSLSFNKGFKHFFGIKIGSNGYGSDDDLNSFINKGVPKEAIENFKSLAPILKKYGIKIKPKMIVTSQIW